MKHALSLRIPLPPRELHPNARPHWGLKAKVARKYRSAVRLLAMVAIRRHLPEGVELPLAEATVFCTFSWPDRRQRDEDGAMASLKAAFDGLQDAGVVKNDRDLHHIFAAGGADPKNPQVLLVIREGNAIALLENLKRGVSIDGL